MNESSELQTVKKVYEAFATGDMNKVLALCGEDTEWELFLPKEIPYAGRFSGHSALRRFFTLFALNAEIQETSVHEFIDGGANIVVLGWDRIGVKATGRNCDINWVHIFTIKGGFVQRFREYFDASPLLEAFTPALRAVEPVSEASVPSDANPHGQ